ncbi:MAG: response regulator transcription factor [Lachnospiraceae bacterium]|nr:response regulator transcription factor [Lachnospiraceae bacterium]
MAKEKILLVEDDPDIREGIRQLLSSESYEVKEAGTGEEGLSGMTPDTDLVILDVMLPGMSGLEVCEKIRETSNVPILFLTARSQESDKLIGLMAGGDDYLPKPFSYAELLGRIKALLRRYCVYQGKEGGGTGKMQKDDWITDGDLSIHRQINEVTFHGKSCDLPEYEYRMLLLMMKNPGRTFSAQQFYELVWNEPYTYACSNTIMVHIRKLRLKVEEDPQNPVRIKTIWGKGYRYEKDRSQDKFSL